MSTDKVQDLKTRKDKIKRGGGEENIRKQHEKGKLTSRERLSLLFDEGSFGVMIAHSADIYIKGFRSFPTIRYDIGDTPENDFEIIGNIYENPELLGAQA